MFTMRYGFHPSEKGWGSHGKGHGCRQRQGRRARVVLSGHPGRSLRDNRIGTYRRAFVQRHGVGSTEYRPLPRPSVFVDKDDLVQRSFQHSHDSGDLSPVEERPGRILPPRNSPPLVERTIKEWAFLVALPVACRHSWLHPLYQAAQTVSKSLSQGPLRVSPGQ